jgi:hypothetical protein
MCEDCTLIVDTFLLRRYFSSPMVWFEQATNRWSDYRRIKTLIHLGSARWLDASG